MAGVGDLPPSMSQSMTGDMMAATSPSNNIMSQSMMVPGSSPLTDKNNDIMSTSTSSLNFKTGKKYSTRSKFAIRSKKTDVFLLHICKAQERK